MDKIFVENVFTKCGEIFFNKEKTLLFQCVQCEKSCFEILDYFIHLSIAHGALDLVNNWESLEATAALFHKTDKTPAKELKRLELVQKVGNISSKPSATSLCNIQGPKEIKDEIISKHSKQQKIPFYRCGNCYQNFSQAKTLSTHVRQCCDKKVKAEELMKDITLFDPNQPSKCQKCDSSFSSSYCLKSHFIRHHSDLQHFHCSVCNASFKLSTSLSNHIRNKHNGMDILKKELEVSNEEVSDCEDQDKHDAGVDENFSFVDISTTDISVYTNANDNFSTSNEIEILESCDEEDFTSKSIDENISLQPILEQTAPTELNRSETLKPVREYIRYRGSQNVLTSERDAKERNFKCSVCGKAFFNKGNLSYHEVRHYEENKKISCSHCPKKFFTNSERKHHELFHVRKRTFLCQECGNSYISRTELTTHLRRHRKERDYKCEICPKAYFHKRYLYNHIRIHQNKRSFKCEYCNEGFNTTNCLKQHIKIHENKRAYKCHICGNGFNQNAGLKCHMKNKHGSID